MKLDRRFFLKGLAAVGLAPPMPEAATAQPALPLVAEPFVPARPGASFSYQWLRDGAPIPDATAANYSIADADSGSDIQVRIVAVDYQGMETRVGEAVRIPGERPVYVPWAERARRGQRYPVRDWL